jgi:hypothetical protein
MHGRTGLHDGTQPAHPAREQAQQTLASIKHVRPHAPFAQPLQTAQDDMVMAGRGRKRRDGDNFVMEGSTCDQTIAEFVDFIQHTARELPQPGE